MSRCTIESEWRYAIADVRWPISKRACGSENLEAAAILSNKSPPKNKPRLVDRVISYNEMINELLV